jgi:hypothetical protein
MGDEWTECIYTDEADFMKLLGHGGSRTSLAAQR